MEQQGYVNEQLEKSRAHRKIEVETIYRPIIAHLEGLSFEEATSILDKCKVMLQSVSKRKIIDSAALQDL